MMERRDFLKVAALTGAAIAVPGLEAMAADRKKATVASVSESAEKYADKPVQKFNFRPDGKFKVMQITDTHYIAGNPKSERALKNVIEMLDIEKPDLVIHTGDIVYGNPADAAAREIFQPLVDRGVPFAVAFGNHESDFEMKREEIFEVIRTIKGNIIFALAVKALVIILACFGLAAIWMSVAADTGVCVICVVISARLLKYKA